MSCCRSWNPVESMETKRIEHNLKKKMEAKNVSVQNLFCAL